MPPPIEGRPVLIGYQRSTGRICFSSGSLRPSKRCARRTRPTGPLVMLTTVAGPSLSALTVPGFWLAMVWTMPCRCFARHTLDKAEEGWSIHVQLPPLRSLPRFRLRLRPHPRRLLRLRRLTSFGGRRLGRRRDEFTALGRRPALTRRMEACSARLGVRVHSGRVRRLRDCRHSLGSTRRGRRGFWRILRSGGRMRRGCARR